MIGHYVRNLDEKGRVMIPTKFRDELGSEFYISVGPDKILEIRDSKSFEAFTSKLNSVNYLNSKAREFARRMLGLSHEIVLDKQGRMSVPESLANITGLTKEVVFVGVGSKVELWSKDKWDALQNESSDGMSLDDLAAELLKDGVEL